MNTGLSHAIREDVLVGTTRLPGELRLPAEAIGLVVFVHGSGSSRHSVRNQFVARVLRSFGLATLLFDLLTDAEAQNRANVFDIGLLGARVVDALHWLDGTPALDGVPLGLFGASTGAAAALVAAAQRPGRVGAVVSRGGRPDLAADVLPGVKAPTLLVVGGQDLEVLELNQQAMRLMTCPRRLEIVPGATHLFEEPGTLDVVASLAGHWFERQLSRAQPS